MSVTDLLAAEVPESGWAAIDCCVVCHKQFGIGEREFRGVFVTGDRYACFKTCRPCRQKVETAEALETLAANAAQAIELNFYEPGGHA